MKAQTICNHNQQAIALEAEAEKYTKEAAEALAKGRRQDYEIAVSLACTVLAEAMEHRFAHLKV